LSNADKSSQSQDGNPLVSVVIPAFNAGRHIQETLISVIGQTYENLEIVVVDDGSTDETARVVSSLAEKDSRITLIQQENAGVAAARNAGIRRSTGSLVLPLDADDICFPGRIVEQVEAMQAAGPDTGVVYSWSARINADSNLIGQVNASIYKGDVAAELLFGNIVGNASASLIRRECFKHVGYFDTSFYARDAQGCEDRDLYLRIAEHYQFSVVKKIHVGYRYTSQAMSGDHARMRRSHDVMVERLRARSPYLSRKLLRQSDAFFLLYLGRISRVGNDARASLAYFIKAAIKDPAFLLCKHFYVDLRVSGIHFVRELLQKLGLSRRRHRVYQPAATVSLEALERKAANMGEPRPGSLQSLRLRRIREARVEISERGLSELDGGELRSLKDT
jgi:glycosyltransferase involved in cell wall biosynthesis